MRLTAASSPHIKIDHDVRVTMGDVIVMLIPIVFLAVFYYGFRSLILIFISALSSIIFEYLYRRLFGRLRSIGDFSAIITGVLIAFNMPVTAPLWFPIVGSFFAIVVVKQLFGGIGKNIFNPAVAAIAFLTVSWPGIMSTFPLPFNPLSIYKTPVGFENGRTTLAALKAGIIPDDLKIEIFFGKTPGYLGTACIGVILMAALYLLYRRIINWQIPIAFIGTVALFAWIFPRSPSGRMDSVVYEIMSGSLIFAAVFMATDPVTSPVTGNARLIYGFCCGIFTVLIRYFGVYPEGAYFAILLMNPFVIEFDRLAWKFRVKGGELLYAKE